MEGNSLDLPGSEFSMHWKYSTDTTPVNSRWGRMIGPRFSWDRMLVYTWVGQIIEENSHQTELYFDQVGIKFDDERAATKGAVHSSP